MAQGHYGLVCTGRGERRVSSGAGCSTPSLPCANSNAVVSGLREGAVSSKRDNLLVEQGSGRGTRHGDALSGVLQSDLLGAQERRHIQASIRLKVPERLRSQGEVQNDYSQGSDTRVAQGALGGKCRFEGRLLPRPHTQEVPPTTAICSRRFRRGQGLSVPRPTVRTNFRATGIHKGDITYRTPGARARRLSPAISRRLDSAEHSQVAVTAAGKMVARGLTSCGTRAQCTEVSTGSYTTLDPHRCRVSPGCRADISTHGQSSTDRAEGVFSPIRPSNDSLLLALPAWDYELRDRCDSPRQIASETTAILLAGPLEAGVKDTVILGSGKARPDRSPPSMVVGSGVYQSWDDSGRSRSASDSVHGCVGFGLGSPCEPISGKWGMVSEGGHSSHKCVRNVSRPQLSNSISDSTGRPNGTVDVRQCVSSVVSLETGRHSIDEPVQSGERSASLSAGFAHFSPCQTYSRRQECVGRPALQEGQSCSHGMDTSPVCGGHDIQHMGQAQCRPIRDTPEQQATGFCLSHGGSTSCGCGRHVNHMEGNVCICVPPICDARSGDRQDPSRSSVRADTDRSQMAQSVLVRQTIGASDRLSFGPAPQERSVESATQPPATSVTPGSVPTRLETVQRSLQEKGFSRAAAEQISRGHRQSSRAVYDSKWRIFAGWCRDRSVDPFQISVHVLAEFFLFLFHEKGLNPRTIKGYRSAISSTISSCGSRSEITNSGEITSLIRSFQLERPPKRKIAPQWNLSLVLQALVKPPFEPIHSIELKFLTLKTVFLVALASGRRRSEIHALCYDSHHFRQNQDQSVLTLYPDLDFVAKSQSLEAVAEPVKIKAFTVVGIHDFDRRLCPVRSLLQYRKFTSASACRQGRKKLFISYKPSFTEEIKKATISSWIVKLIHLAYSTEGKNPGVLELHKVTAHEVRALSASTSAFRGMATEAIMQSCTWRSRSTFSDFYLRDMCAFLDDIFVMSSSVAGNASVSSIPVTSHQ